MPRLSLNVDKTELEKAIQILRQHRYGKWEQERMDKFELDKVMIFCLVSPRIKQDVLYQFRYSDEHEQIAKGNLSMQEIETCLHRWKIFPAHKKSREIYDYFRSGVNIYKLVHEIHASYNGKQITVEDERAVRKEIANKINGIGLKTASLFLLNIGFTRNLAAIDSRHVKFLQDAGIVHEIKDWQLQHTSFYHSLEDAEIAIAEKLGITVSGLDALIMSLYDTM